MSTLRAPSFCVWAVVLAGIPLMCASVRLGASPVDISIDAATSTGFVKPLLGINAGPTPTGDAGNADVSAQYRDVGVNLVRNHDFNGPTDMYTMYPDTSADPSLESSYDFTESDIVMAAIHNNGHEIYFRLGNSYSYGGAPPANIPNWIEAAKNVVRHYTRGKWNGFEYPIRHVEMWNEPENLHFWTGMPIEFLNFFEAVAKALKAEFPQLKIGGPGFVPAGYSGGTFPQTFLEYCSAHSVPLDFLSWHVYSNNPMDYHAAGIYYRQLLNSHGYMTATSHISEWNTEHGPERYNAVGAAQMTGAWISLQNVPVDVSTFYRGTDTGVDFPEFYGIFYADGRYKKIAHAFKAWSRMVDHPRKVHVSGHTTGTAALAAVDDNGRALAILLSHHTVRDFPDSIDMYRLHISGFLAAGETAVMRRYDLSATQDLALVEEIAVTLPGPITRPFPVDVVHLIILSEPVSATQRHWDLY